MTVGLKYQQLKSALEKLYPTEEAAAIASAVIEYHTEIPRHQIPLKKNDLLGETTINTIQQNLESLLTHQPLQYVLNEAWFYGLRLYVDSSVLIPRPETEELVHEAIQQIRSIHATSNNSIRILDIGTGSGCIPIALKKECINVQVHSIDISEQALTIAQKNAIDNQTEIAFNCIDFLDEATWDALGNYDIIISNPPYITIKEKETLEKNVSEWEPATALFVPDNDPLLFYRKISRYAASQLNDNGLVMMECHYQFAELTKEMFLDAGYNSTLKKDMHGNDRILIAQKVQATI